jgi:hypothetical protein
LVFHGLNEPHIAGSAQDLKCSNEVLRGYDAPALHVDDSKALGQRGGLQCLEILSRSDAQEATNL